MPDLGNAAMYEMSFMQPEALLVCNALSAKIGALYTSPQPILKAFRPFDDRTALPHGKANILHILMSSIGSEIKHVAKIQKQGMISIRVFSGAAELHYNNFWTLRRRRLG
jgi:hypothetical protein